jgi:hypothetical protein
LPAKATSKQRVLAQTTFAQSASVGGASFSTTTNPRPLLGKLLAQLTLFFLFLHQLHPLDFLATAEHG